MPPTELTTNRRILVVDDTEATRYAIARVLRNEGFQVIEASNGHQALVAANQELPDLITLDIHMPDINGFDVCRRLKSETRTSHIPVLQVSASYVTSKDKIHGLEGGADSYLTHPFEPAVLVATVKSLLRTKGLHELLHASESRLQAIFTHVAAGMAVANLEGRFTQVNPAFSRLTGYTESELLSMSFKLITHPDFYTLDQNHRHELIKSQAGSKVFEKRCVRKNGIPFEVQSTLSPIHDAQGNAIGTIEVLEDITDRKYQAKMKQRLTEQLEQKSALLETVLEQFPAAVVIGEAPTGKLIFANSKVKEVWKHPFRPADDISGYQDWIGFHPDGSRYLGKDWPLARSISKGEVIVNEDTDVLRGDNTRGTLRLNAAPVLSPKGDVIAGVVVAQDYTEIKKAEIELQKAKEAAESASQVKSAFIANMSHEIRTPLGAMLGFTELLKDPNVTSEERDSYLGIISRNGQQLSDIINDILDLSKIEAGHVSIETLSVSPELALRDIISLLTVKAQEKSLPLHVRIHNNVPSEIGTDPTRLKQILTNIIGNAIKFTQHGSVEVQISYLRSPTMDHPNLIVFDVIDTGIGLNKDQQDRLFQVFTQADASTTRKYGGTGLGLTLSRRLANILGGDVTLVESSTKSGSHFRISLQDRIDQLDTNSSPSFQEPAELLPEEISIEGTRILLVEDAIDNQNLLSHILTKKNAFVDIAQNGLEGVQKALSGSYDVVLMDVQMPLMDGYTATAKLRERGFKKPILALTAHALTEVREKCLNVGCSGYLSKPINAKELIRSIRKFTKPELH